MIQLDLFGDHALAFDDASAGLFFADGMDLLQRLRGGLRPDDAAAAFGEDGFEFLQLFVEGLDGAPFDILGPLACEVQIRELLLALRHNCVIAADIEIDLFAVVQVLRLDRAAGDEVSCGFCHSFLRCALKRHRNPFHIFG